MFEKKLKFALSYSENFMEVKKEKDESMKVFFQKKKEDISANYSIHSRNIFKNNSLPDALLFLPFDQAGDSYIYKCITHEPTYQ